ncbi:hypothetical protein DSM106972_000990 [Dulcicalothrix desertica PCC 7102]|uniref:Uncharacterized protein n=1 Tax=Dulcicalothrix desertica PCC 7102 TaxID=232991 RepID=A0A3S1ARS7_9CYAN|nr:hypothetical protein [Dulcicalothrix desertica]RUT09605.1 hypothetical protein DSM106972_000990 [Dulcicalothrix desertica PCC 7102]TWH50804.1 hypothetical protein CAL7102_05148 [Dulcicalothrix desertica PCC 7102]
MEQEINCKVQCVNGCVLGDENCPNKEVREAASKFIEDTSLDKMIEMAEAARLKKLTEPPKWILPDDI